MSEFRKMQIANRTLAESEAKLQVKCSELTAKTEYVQEWRR
jgi:hypothetical protein